MPIQVNYYNKIVYITSPTTTVTVQELVDAIRTAEDTPEGISFGGSVATMVDAVIDAEGKAGVGGGFLAGIVMTLKSDWYIEFWDGVVLGTVSGGNVTGGLADRPVRCAVGSADTALQLGAVGGVIAETGVSGLTSEESDALLAIELATDNIPGDVWSEALAAYSVKGSAGETKKALAYENVVSYDSVSGEAGTTWPIGTHQYPVNNIADMLVIATARSLDTVLVHTDLTIGASDNVDGMIFMSEGRMGTTITLTAGCSVNGAAFRYLNLQGEMTNGDVLLVESCSLPNSFINFSGIMNLVAFADGAELHIGTWATLINCNAGGEPTNEPEIDVNAASVTINGWNGNVKIVGKTASNRTTVNLMAGNIILDSTCVAGTIQLMGVGFLEADNTGGGCNVDLEAFLSRPQIADSVWDEVKTGHVTADSFGVAVKDMEVDLNNPDQYKADVAALALETTAQAIKDKTDNLPTDPADQSAVEAAISTSETNIRGTDSDDLKVLSDQLDLVAPAGEYDSELVAIQADLDDPDQYKADVSVLALEATLQLVKTEADKIPSLEILLTFLEDIEGGRWRIENNQMIFYKPDNTTEVARFNLFDAAGDPAEEDVFERTRV